MNTPKTYTLDDAAIDLVRLVQSRTAIGQDFLIEDHTVAWSVIAHRWDMLSHGEKAVLVLASELGDAPIDHHGAPGIYLVMERCDDSYRIQIANILANVLLP